MVGREINKNMPPDLSSLRKARALYSSAQTGSIIVHHIHYHTLTRLALGAT